MKQLGIHLDLEYHEQRKAGERHLANSRKRRREAGAGGGLSEPWNEFGSPPEAYLAEDYAALHALECELNTHEDD